MEKLIRVIYVSSSVSDISEHDTLRFLKQARTVNLKHDEVADTRVFSLPLIVAGTGAPPPSSSAIPPRTSASSPPG